MFRLNAHGVGSASPEQIVANAAGAEARGLPFIERIAPHERPLAVVGGGPSTLSHLGELREFADIWAINGTCQWLRSHGIDSILFSVDPGGDMPPLCKGVDRAILASNCHPAAFDALEGKDVRIFHTFLREDAGPEIITLREKFAIVPGTTSACSAPLAALRMGYKKLVYFGCEGSFGETTHSFKDEDHESQVIIRAGGEDYRTNLQFYMQSEYLAKLCRLFPTFLEERSGGLLRAMSDHPDSWEVVALSGHLANHWTR
jgi:hypothetical protein